MSVKTESGNVAREPTLKVFKESITMESVLKTNTESIKIKSFHKEKTLIQVAVVSGFFLQTGCENM